LEKGAVDASCIAGRAATYSILADLHVQEDTPVVAVSASVDRPRIPHPLHVRLFHEEVAELVWFPCPEVVPSIARAYVPASRCLAKGRCGRTELVCPKEGTKVVASYISPLNAVLTADAVASCALGVVRVAHPDRSIRVCANDENGIAAGLDAALRVISVGLLLAIRPAAVWSARTHEENGKWSLCRVNSDEASGEGA
jgi:hypothetical protein